MLVTRSLCKLIKLWKFICVNEQDDGSARNTYTSMDRLEFIISSDDYETVRTFSSHTSYSVANGNGTDASVFLLQSNQSAAKDDVTFN